MNLSADHIQGLATETGFRPETLEKVIRLGELAADIGRHPLLSRVLALKGGTALNLMFGSPARLSVDLDFNYIGQVERAGMQADRPEVERAIVIIGEGQESAFSSHAMPMPAGRFILSTKTCPVRLTG
jgi:predicted nucleotidyltransferase component of viral defense system